jgi:pyruvate/2-oxoglutarate dehydrogenase complex dihydrolipoamide acyltransferase (E2) component
VEGPIDVRYEVTLPELGEDTPEEANVSQWLVKPGEQVSEGDDLLELTTDKAAFNVPSPRDGILKECRVEEGDDVPVGAVLCVLEVD